MRITTKGLISGLANSVRSIKVKLLSSEQRIGVRFPSDIRGWVINHTSKKLNVL